MPVNCHCIKGKCRGDYPLRILSWTCDSHPWSMNPSCRALPGTFLVTFAEQNLLADLALVCCRGEKEQCRLLACLLASLQPLRSQNWTPPTLLVEDHLISSDSPAPHCLPPVVGTKKKRRKSWGLEFCDSLCFHPGTCMFQIPVGRSELTLSGCIPAQRGGSSPFLALPGWLKGLRAENHLPNIACAPWSLLS